MGSAVNLATEVVHRYVFELRYDLGQVYWDRAGRVAKEILAQYENWDFNGIDIQSCQVGLKDKNLTFSFGPGKLDLAQTQGPDVDSLLPIGEFGKIADDLAAKVVKLLELERFPRMGLRVWHLYPAGDRDQSYGLVRKIKLFQIDPVIAKTIGSPSEVAYRVLIDRPTHMLRIAIAPFEQMVELPESTLRAARSKVHKQPSEQRKQLIVDQLKAKKAIAHYPQFGLLLDLDAYIEDPLYPDNLSISDFIQHASDDFRAVKNQVLESANVP